MYVTIGHAALRVPHSDHMTCLSKALVGSLIKPMPVTFHM